MTDSDLRNWYLRYIATLDAHELEKMDEFIADEVMLNGEPGTRDNVIAEMKHSIDAVPASLRPAPRSRSSSTPSTRSATASSCR